MVSLKKRKKVVIYSSISQSLKDIRSAVSGCFSQHIDFRCLKEGVNHFIEPSNEVEARTFSQMKAAIRTCQSTNAALLLVRDIERKGYLETLLLLRESGLKDLLTAHGELSLSNLDAAIRYETMKRQRISEGTKRALAKRKLDGFVLGSPSFPTIRNSDTEAASKAKIEQAYEDALKLIAEIDNLPVSELYSHNNIAKQLNKRGITTRRGRPINRGTIKRAYERVGGIEEYSALYVYPG